MARRRDILEVGLCPHCGSSRIRLRRQRHRNFLWRCRSCNRAFRTPRVRQVRLAGADPSRYVLAGDIHRLERVSPKERQAWGRKRARSSQERESLARGIPSGFADCPARWSLVVGRGTREPLEPINDSWGFTRGSEDYARNSVGDGRTCCAVVNPWRGGRYCAVDCYASARTDDRNAPVHRIGSRTPRYSTTRHHIDPFFDTITDPGADANVSAGAGRAAYGREATYAGPDQRRASAGRRRSR